MTVKKAIETADRRMSGNEYPVQDKLEWLRTLESMWQKFKETRGYNESVSQVEEDNPDCELSIEEPHDEIYVTWLVMKMHFYNGEIDLYNNSAEVFNAQLEKAKEDFKWQNPHRFRDVKHNRFHSFKEV